MLRALHLHSYDALSLLGLGLAFPTRRRMERLLKEISLPLGLKQDQARA